MKFAHFSSENSGQNNGRTSPFWGKNSGQGLVLKQGFPVFTIMRVKRIKVFDSLFLENAPFFQRKF